MYLSRVCITFSAVGDGAVLANGTYHVATSGKTKAEIVAAALVASRKHELMDDRVSHEVIRVAILFTANADNPKALAEKLEEWDDTNPEMLFGMVHDAANVIAAHVNEGGLHSQLVFIRSVQKDYAALLAETLDSGK